MYMFVDIHSNLRAHECDVITKVILSADVQQPLSSRADHYQKFTLKHSDDPQHVKSKKLHKKHKQEVHFNN